MEWNSLLTDLNYYLAELYSDAPNYPGTKRVLKSAGVNVIHIPFAETAVDSWSAILDRLRKQGKEQVINLLTVITSPKKEGYDKDEFLLSAIRNLQEEVRAVEVSDATIRGSEQSGKGWKSGPLTDATKEKIIGKKSTLLPISFLEKGLIASKAVVRIVVGDELGTGFLLQNNWLMTNHHVIHSIEEAKTAIVQFNYQYQLTPEKVIDLFAEKTDTLNPGNKAEDRLFFTNEEEDWTLVKLKSDMSAYGCLQLAEISVAAEDNVNIIQHPSGGAKQIAVYNNTVMFASETIVQYLTDTMPGSSGSPVFNSDWKVVAIHHSGGWIEEPVTKNKKFLRNQGTNIQRVKTFIEENALFKS